VNDTGSGGYQVLGTSFSAPSPACGVIVNSGTHVTETDTLVASGSQPAAGTCIYIIDDSITYLTIAASGQTLYSGNSTGSLVIIPGYGAQVVSDGTNYYAQVFAAGQNGINSNSVYGGGSYSGTATVRETILGSGIGNTSSTGYSNTFVGTTMAAGITSGAANVGLGYNSLGSLTSGSFNIGLGYEVGFGNMATGSDNLLIGYNGTNYCDTPASGTSSYVCIENLVYGTSGSAGGKVGIEGPKPSIVSNACGSTAQGTLATGSSDSSGEVTVGTTGVTSCAVSFANNWTNAPFCIISEQTSLATVLGLGYTISTSALTVTATSGFSGTKFDYHCFAGSNSANAAP
jgi:hypothetical protein